jgi:hypothetical protein
MSTVSAPLLSLNASGKFANTLVASTWKGKPVLRKYTVPANPNTSAQIAHRAKFTAAVAAWRTWFIDGDMRDAWTKLATKLGLVMSGFNLFTKNVVDTYAANISFVTSNDGTAAAAVSFVLKNSDDGATGDEAGNFELWIGDSIQNMQYFGTDTIAAGALSYDVHGKWPATTNAFYYIKKSTSYRSGIFNATLS